MLDTAPLPWDTLARYRLIEILALWEGRVVASQIGEAFGIGRQQSQKVLRRYRELAPDNLAYDESRKGFLPTDRFIGHFTQGRVEEYLHLLGAGQGLESPFAGLGLGAADTESLPLPSRKVSPDVVRELVKGARQQLRLEVSYASFTNPRGEERVIVPHTLVYAAGRWHVRAFCEKHLSYRDFVLSRFRDIPEPCGGMLGEHGRECDSDWQTIVSVKLIPDQRLPEPERQLIALDYAMKAGTLELSCRGPLVLYALRELGVNPNHTETDPRAQQIQIANAAELKHWIRWD
ncbi:Predicted DNA-binding transcriptional regulator YafY, contains an HTH and WYL domains [Franzmannia pantelleriensis]|uniref:Predicted DNA-binding transcriptional regulator YafY, contains an HTH and WYL domains n=1 Tax=Franzmannia pantelleriensis TaxID=48727 RepID=A0A1G9X3S7_9GAMM|nr:WYL domain-containing protein [Halomonas pantelleriensis]SDM91399.1 Predicted DNA-binding transcriptional regulator YafY, contains an HTH and WYL domains [Halomonas pantelleriensis]